MTRTSPTAGANARDRALDFTKGVLVFTMVLYHWMNYFTKSDYDFFRYLRFLTPSFIFITGFLIAHTYLPTYRPGDWRLPRKLLRRGLKILGLFVMLNLLIGAVALVMNGWRVPADAFSAGRLAAIYLTGNVLLPGGVKLASFAILVPIAYLLLMAAILVPLWRTFRHVFTLVSAACLLLILVLYSQGSESSNLELITIGLLGIVSGAAADGELNRVSRWSGGLLTAYAVYLAAITIWNVHYPVQVIGVYLTLMLIYASGTRLSSHRAIEPIILAGRYSLFGYIIQLVIIQGLRVVPWSHIAGAASLPASFLAAVCLTTLMIEAVDRTRATMPAINRVYLAVFA